MKKIILLVLAITVSSLVYSYSILESQTGNYVLNLDARTSAMGSAGVANGMHLFDSFLNPANLGLLPDRIGAQVGMSVVQDSDNRTLPMYNSFDAYSGDATYASNLNYFNDYSAGAYYRYGFDKCTVSAALAYRPFISFDADYFEDVRNNYNSNNNSYPQTIAKNYIKSKGNIEAISFLAAFKYEEIATIGLEVSSLSGDSKWERRINWSDWSIAKMQSTPYSLVDSDSTLNRDFSGMMFKIGLTGKINERLQVGLSYQPQIEFDLSGSINDSIDVEDAVYMYYSKLDTLGMVVHTDSIMYSEYISPSRMRFGVSYTPQNIMKTYFNADVEYVSWSEQNELFDDQYNFYVGVEHVLPNNIPIRLGFNYTTSYSTHEIKYNGKTIAFADKITMPSFSAGTGFNLLSKFTVDISLEYANRQYEALDLFMDNFYWRDSDYQYLWANPSYIIASGGIPDRTWENPDTVKETLLQLKTSITYKW
ncbi:MAG: hypothetical protein Q7J16_13710 [Candidatus Cloacimonadales bacterium]|nr:hypothetical protein [Candidatus Cloacimonadales bacterium]